MTGIRERFFFRPLSNNERAPSCRCCQVLPGWHGLRGSSGERGGMVEDLGYGFFTVSLASLHFVIFIIHWRSRYFSNIDFMGKCRF